jgi:aminoglycoside phosphotransferase (APT) family kinase protein
MAPARARDRRPLQGRLIAGGRSNLTYEVSDGTRSWVVRRPPLGHVLATAHDMAREYRVITALPDTSVPVPLSYALCTDPDVLGAPFYVMSAVNGVAYRTADQLSAVGPARARAIAERMVGTLALLHAVVPAEVGLADFGRPEGFLARQVRRWKKQLDASRSRPLPGIDELHDLLAANTPDGTSPTIVHGDYRINRLVGTMRVIAAVLDWEMATSTPVDRRRAAHRLPADEPARRGPDGEPPLAPRGSDSRALRVQRARPVQSRLLHRPRLVQVSGDP